MNKDDIMRRWFDIITNIAFVCTCFFLFWILAQVFVFASFRIPSDSMSPKLREGDFVLVWKPVVGARVCTCFFLFWILAQVFVFASFRIPSDSMSPKLREGDFVLVWKPVVGARLFNLNKSLNLEQTDIYRLPGFRKIKRNDVVVFNFPHPNDWSRIEMHIMKYYIKRCIGLPGDIYRLPGFRKIKRNDVVVFNFPHPNDWSRIEMHIMKYYIKRCIGLPGDTVSIRKGMFKVDGVDIPLGNVASQERIGLMRPEDFPEGVYRSFPYDSLLDWNIQEFGPLFVPGEGDAVKMNRTGGVLYRKLIEWEQGKKMYVKGDTVLLNDSVITSYQLRKNYYFVAGDQGENSQDSRYWGLLPEEYIVGVASRIWKSSVITSYQLRKNYYFVAGDQGENSQDSRYWGLLPEEYIVGVASRIWKSEDSYTGDICWDRVWKKIE